MCEQALIRASGGEHGRGGPHGERGEVSIEVDRGAARRSNDATQHVGRGVDHDSSDVEPPTIMHMPCMVKVYESCNADHGYER